VPVFSVSLYRNNHDINVLTSLVWVISTIINMIKLARKMALTRNIRPIYSGGIIADPFSIIGVGGGFAARSTRHRKTLLNRLQNLQNPFDPYFIG
jgi:hypothetical protein